MSRIRLPQELLDHIIDFLCDSYPTLNICCLVSKQWIPRTRKHLFAEIEFETAHDVHSWNSVFSDPSTSGPACYAKALLIGYPYVIKAAGKGKGLWLSAFSRVAHLTMSIPKRDPKAMEISLIPFHGFSLVLKSLNMDASALTHSQVFDLVRSYPLLENLSIDSLDHGDGGNDTQPTATQPLNSPQFTGSLNLCTYDSVELITSRLLSLPNGIRFQTLGLMWHHEEDVLSTAALVKACRFTLESLEIEGGFLDLSQVAQVNLSKAKELSSVTLICWLSPGLIFATLRTITRNHRRPKSVTLQVSG